MIYIMYGEKKMSKKQPIKMGIVWHLSYDCFIDTCSEIQLNAKTELKECKKIVQFVFFFLQALVEARMFHVVAGVYNTIPLSVGEQHSLAFFVVFVFDILDHNELLELVTLSSFLC